KERPQENEERQIAVVKVTDTGCGIDPAIVPRIFEKFVTRSDKGTGLGLFVSKSIIQAHEGRIWVQNNTEGEKGATFCFTLPCK
ncbi:MAG: ATP-binding protein, partial [Nitrososphaeraceae archaeon]